MDSKIVTKSVKYVYTFNFLIIISKILLILEINTKLNLIFKNSCMSSIMYSKSIIFIQVHLFNI